MKAILEYPFLQIIELKEFERRQKKLSFFQKLKKATFSPSFTLLWTFFLVALFHDRSTERLLHQSLTRSFDLTLKYSKYETQSLF